MAKIIVFNLVTLDGYYAGPNGEIDWHNTDEEFGKFSEQQMLSFKTLIFGRTTYELMKSYWPTPEAIKNDPVVAKALNTLPKIVFSKTLKKVKEESNWKNISLFNKIDAKEIRKLKQKSKYDLIIMGSGTVVQQFANLELIDEYRLLVNPVILYQGKLLFANLKTQHTLKLTSTRTFKNGNVLLTYKNEK